MNWDYIAGFFDADGSITAVRTNKKKNKTLQLSFHNNEVYILDQIRYFILKELGIMGSISLKKAKKETHQDSYDLKYTYQNALKVANSIKTIHNKKKHRVKIYNLIQKNTKRNGKYSEEELKYREELLELFFKTPN